MQYGERDTDQADANTSWVREDTSTKLQMSYTNKNITANGIVDSDGNGTCLYDLGTSNISDSGWIIDFDYDITAYTNYTTGASAPNLFIGFSSQNASNGTGDHLFLKIYSYDNTIKLAYGNGSTVNNSTTSSAFTATPSQLGNYYVRFIRTGTDLFTIQLFSDSARSILIQEKEQAISSAYTGLRYFGIFQANSEGSGDGVIRSTVDNIKIYNAVTSLTSKPTDVPDNSILVEKDTARRYWLSGSTWTMQPTFADAFTADNGTQTGTLMAVDTVTDMRIEGSQSRSTTNHNWYMDLETLMGNTIDSSAFMCRFKLQNLTFTQDTANQVITFIGLSSVNGTTLGSQEVGDHAQIWIDNQSGGSIYRVDAVDNDTMVGSTPTSLSETPAVNTRYVELIMNGTTLTLNLYSDSGYSTLVESATDSNALEGLKYFVVQNQTIAVSTSDGSGTFAIDDIEFYNGVTSIT